MSTSREEHVEQSSEPLGLEAMREADLRAKLEAAYRSAFAWKMTARVLASDVSQVGGTSGILADELERLCCAETEGKFFDCVTNNIATIIHALRQHAFSVENCLDAPWREKWNGSDPQRGWSIVGPDGPIAYIGGDEALSAAVSAIVTAHNAALHLPEAEIQSGWTGELPETVPERVDLPPITERGLAGQIMDAAWPHFGGEQIGADFWYAFSAAVEFCIRAIGPSEANSTAAPGLTPIEREELLTGDIRWAVNYLLEQIAQLKLSRSMVDDPAPQIKI